MCVFYTMKADDWFSFFAFMSSLQSSKLIVKPWAAFAIARPSFLDLRVPLVKAYRPYARSRQFNDMRLQQSMCVRVSESVRV